MFCAKCGTKQQPEAKFCQSCGNQVMAQTQPSPVAFVPNTASKDLSPQSSSKGYHLFVTILKVVVGLGVTGAVVAAGLSFYLAKQGQSEKEAICRKLLSKPAPPWPDCASEQAAAYASARPGETGFAMTCKYYNDTSKRNKYENCKLSGSPD